MATIKLNNVYLEETYTIAGKKEHEGPLGNYYDEIVNGNCLVKNMKIGKYYYFYKGGRYYNEKDYLKLFN